MNRLLSFLVLVFAASTSLPTYAQVTGFNIVKPAGAPGAILTLPGSTRRLALNCATGCSTANVATWSITATTGGASAKLIPSSTGNFVDIVLGPQTYHRLPEMVARASRAGGRVVETDFPAEDKFDHLPDSATPQGVTAFLTVQEGCDKFCSFCVVPYTRGNERMRPKADIVAEVREAAQTGHREVQLLGQIVNHYVAPDDPGRCARLAPPE